MKKIKITDAKQERGLNSIDIEDGAEVNKTDHIKLQIIIKIMRFTVAVHWTDFTKT